MSNININSLFQRFSDSVIIYSIILVSLSFTINGSTMHAICGTDIELACPISSMKKTDEVISWFRPNSSQTPLTFIAIGDILFPEYASIGRYNLVSSLSASRLLINNIQLEDQGIYTCKSSSSGQHIIKLHVKSQLYIYPPFPVLLYPVNQTFSLTCSILCNVEINTNDLHWFINGELLNHDNYDYDIETISSNTQRLTFNLNKKHKKFIQANFTCKYNEKEATVSVRRRTKEELHRLPRKFDSSAAHSLPVVFDTGLKKSLSVYMMLFLFLFLWFY